MQRGFPFGTVHKPHGLFCFWPWPPLPHRGFTFKKTRFFFEKKRYLPAGCLRHKRTLVIIIICYIVWKKYGTVLIRQNQSRTGKEKVIANEENGRRGPEKDAHLKTPSLMWCVPGPTTVSAQKQPERPHVIFFVGLPPSPIVVLQETPVPLNRPRSLCTVPQRITNCTVKKKCLDFTAKAPAIIYRQTFSVISHHYLL